MFVLEDDFIIKLVSSQLKIFSEEGVSNSDFEEFLSNLSIPLINSLSDSDKHVIGYCFNSYSYQIYSEYFYNTYCFVSEFETKYSLF